MIFADELPLPANDIVVIDRIRLAFLVLLR